MAAQVTPLPQAPSINDPLNFEVEADAFVGSLGTLVTEINALSTEVEGHATTAEADAATATLAKNQAVAASATAQSAAVKWTTSTNYLEGAVVWSPVNFQNYRKITAGNTTGGTTDPSLNPTIWATLGSYIPSLVLLNMGVI